MSDQRKTIATVLITVGAVVLVVGIGVTAFVAGRAARTVDEVNQVVEQAIDAVDADGDFERVGEVTVESIRNLSELTTVEYVEYTTVEKGRDDGILNWATGDKIEMFAVARIGAGVDLGGLEEGDIFADPTTRRAIIRIPEADITYVAVDNERTVVYNRETGIFTSGDPDLERAARITAEAELVDQALEDDILGEAEDRAETILEDLLESLGYTDVNVIVVPGNDSEPPASTVP
jgi:hypothetical protein